MAAVCYLNGQLWREAGDSITQSRVTSHHSVINENVFCRIFIYTHRRMAITADDVSLEDIIPISLDFAVVEGELPSYACNQLLR